MKNVLTRIQKDARHAEFWVFLFASLFLILFALSEVQVLLHAERFSKSAMLRLILMVLICTLFYLGGLLYADRKNNRKVMRILMWLFFGLYLYLLLNFTLLDKGMGRNALIPESIEGGREYYVNRFVNLKPFQSIYDVYIQGFLNGYVNSYYMLLNLLGNTCAFMPLSFFLPHFWRGQRRWYVFLPTLTVSVAVVEALQFAFMVGCCDVDDLILNVGGAMILYFFFRIPLLSRALKVFANGGTWKETE